MQPTPGRIVHYVMPTGEHLPAMVTGIEDNGDARLSIFTNDDTSDPIIKRGDVAYGDDSVDGAYPPKTWHWPERDEPRRGRVDSAAVDAPPSGP